MSTVRLGAVGYLNARPLVFGVDAAPRFSLRYDIPSRCAALLHDGTIDVGLVPSIEYLRGASPYAIVPGPAVVSHGPVASVALYTRVDDRDIKSIAMDTSSRTSVALSMVLAAVALKLAPNPIPMVPDLESMLSSADAALIIGDNALLLDHEAAGARKIDLGELWQKTTGLPFVYAFWAGRPEALTPADVGRLRQARDEGVACTDAIANAYFAAAEQRATARRYLRDNIQYVLGETEIEGLRTFYRYASDLGLASFDGQLRFYGADDSGNR
jgi:chorismate dehydratase